MVLGSYEFRDYIVSHHKRILDTSRKEYEFQWRSNVYKGLSYIYDIFINNMI